MPTCIFSTLWEFWSKIMVKHLSAFKMATVRMLSGTLPSWMDKELISSWTCWFNKVRRCILGGVLEVSWTTILMYHWEAQRGRSCTSSHSSLLPSELSDGKGMTFFLHVTQPLEFWLCCTPIILPWIEWDDKSEQSSQTWASGCSYGLVSENWNSISYGVLRYLSCLLALIFRFFRM